MMSIYKPPAIPSLDFEENDRLIQLPDDILFSIMCRLTTKEAAKLCVLSLYWNKLWACYPGILNFEDLMTYYERKKLARDACSIHISFLVDYDTKRFVRWVTRVVEQHVGPSLKEFKVAFDLNNTYQSEVDKWVVFALLKGVSSLELQLNGNEIIDIERKDFYSMPLKCCIAHKSPHGLKTLVLSHMEITAEVLDCFLKSCPFLENLRLCNVSSLGSIRASLLRLKHFDVSDSEVEIIDILAPKLLSFTYHGFKIELNIRNALSLSEMSIGSESEDEPTHVCKSLSQYFPQVEYLHMRFPYVSYREKMVASSFSSLTNVKHLKLSIKAYFYESLLGWMTLIEASPVLQKLTLELNILKRDYLYTEKAEKRTSPAKPLKCLKKLEVYGFVALEFDIELVTYVIENAIALEEVFIDLQGYFIEQAELDGKRAEAEFKEKLPLGAKLIINNRFQMHNYMHSYPRNEFSTEVYSPPGQGMFGRISKLQRKPLKFDWSL